MNSPVDRTQFTLVTPPDSPCGCGRNKTFGECHLKDGTLNVDFTNINPPAPLTGDSTKKCYFAYTNNCAGPPSKEHIVSRAVLKNLSEKEIVLTRAGVSRTYSLDSPGLTVRRLCKRHNNAFRVDSEAGRLFRSIVSAEKQLASGEITHPLYFFHRFDIERWLLKTVLNIFHSSVSVSKLRLPANIMAGFHQPLPNPFGLYFEFSLNGGTPTAVEITSQKVEFSLMLEGDLVIGASIGLAGIAFKYLIAGNTPFQSSFRDKHVHRPKTLNFFQDREVVTVLFVGGIGTELDVWMGRRNPTAEVPTGIGGLIGKHIRGNTN